MVKEVVELVVVKEVVVMGVVDKVMVVMGVKEEIVMYKHTAVGDVPGCLEVLNNLPDLYYLL